LDWLWYENLNRDHDKRGYLGGWSSFRLPRRHDKDKFFGFLKSNGASGALVPLSLAR